MLQNINYICILFYTYNATLQYIELYFVSKDNFGHYVIPTASRILKTFLLFSIPGFAVVHKMNDRREMICHEDKLAACCYNSRCFFEEQKAVTLLSLQFTEENSNQQYFWRVGENQRVVAVVMVASNRNATGSKRRPEGLIAKTIYSDGDPDQ